MMYSSGSLAVRLKAKEYLTSGSSILAERRVEISDPTEVTEDLISSTIGISADGQITPSGGSTSTEEKKSFARPKGPGRKR